MAENFFVMQKLGCNKYALDNCILIKASVEAVSKIFQEYFSLKVRSNCKIIDYFEANKASWDEIERQRKVLQSRRDKSQLPVLWVVPFWRYLNHPWTIFPLFGTEESIAFALALLLNTETITFYDSHHASYNEFKVFCKDQLVEHYLFGFECGKDFKNDWDIKIEDSEFDNWSNYEHRFKSSTRQVTEAELRAAFLARKYDRDNRGFLDACLKYYKAYIPLREETPYHYHGTWNSDFQDWNLMVERMDMVILPSNWSYVD